MDTSKSIINHITLPSCVIAHRIHISGVTLQVIFAFSDNGGMHEIMAKIIHKFIRSFFVFTWPIVARERR